MNHDSTSFHLFLHPEPFALIKSGMKTIEMRLYDERRRQIAIGDIIIFENREGGDKIEAEVIELATYPSFNELYEHYPKSKLGYERDEVANPDDMLKYYSKENIEKYGVLAIEIRLI